MIRCLIYIRAESGSKEIWLGHRFEINRVSEAKWHKLDYPSPTHKVLCLFKYIHESITHLFVTLQGDPLGEYQYFLQY